MEQLLKQLEARLKRHIDCAVGSAAHAHPKMMASDTWSVKVSGCVLSVKSKSMCATTKPLQSKFDDMSSKNFNC